MSFFFDSHFHATLKKQFANPDSNPPGGRLPAFHPWHTATRADFLEGFKAISIVKCLLRPFVESSLVSQSSLSQMSDSGYKLSVMALFAPDKGLMELIVNNRDFINIVKNGKFGDFLVNARFETLRDANNAFEILKRDLELLELTAPGRSVTKLMDGQFNPKPEDPLALVFSVEGLHSLRSDLKDTDENRIIEDILQNLDSLKDKIRILTVNLTHIDSNNNVFANQGYAMDGFREAGFVEINLRPVGFGITTAGCTIATKLYERNILPDVKHMSWTARKDFYQFRKDNNITAPLVCSHAGFTGCWFNGPGESITDFIIQVGDERRVNTPTQHRIILSKPNPYLESSGIGFNASSINLFNEDIREILESDGLIGISFDQRILGFSDFQDSGNVLSKNIIDIEGLGKVVTDSDFISAEEFRFLPHYQQRAANLNKIMRGVFTEHRTKGNLTDDKNFFQPRHFYLHIAHAIQVARMVAQLNNSSEDDMARKMLTRTLCIGSDFDGMIDGLDFSPDVTRMEKFKSKFVKEFGPFLEKVKVKLPEGMKVQTVADRIFYENGKDFVIRRLQVINGEGPVA